jgi:hypothetical protein
MSFGRCVNNDKANKQRQFQQADARGRLFSNSRSLLGGEWCYREQMPETSDFVGAFVTTRAHVARQRKLFVGRRRPQIRLDLDQRRSFAAKGGESDQNGRLRGAIQYHWLKFAYMTK